MKVKNVDLICNMGDDLLVVNAARVSFHKHSTSFSEKDAKLIRYLAENKHWTPFAHPHITFRVSAPVFVRTQLFKHKVGLVENEVSRRYVDDDPYFFFPDEWRGKPTNGAKQGSSGPVDCDTQALCYNEYSKALEKAQETYELLLEKGVAPEQARMVLPQSMLTEWYWTGSLYAFSRVCQLRLDPHAQKETRDIAQEISDILMFLYPISWAALVGAKEEQEGV